MNLPPLITIPSVFQTWTLQRIGWTHGRFEDLQQCKKIILLAWRV